MKERKYIYNTSGGDVEVIFNDIANQSDSSVMVKMGETVLMATVNVGVEKGVDYLPLVVEYEERHYAVGSILGGRYLRREARPSDNAVLKCRLIDRSIRPLFNQGIRNDIQIVIMVLSLGEEDPRSLGVLAASLALATSSVEWGGPISAVSGCLHQDRWSMYSKRSTINSDVIDGKAIFCGTDADINMVEFSGKQVKEDLIVSGAKEFHKEIQNLQEFQKMIIKKEGKEKTDYKLYNVPEEVKVLFTDKVKKEVEKLFYSTKDKKGYALAKDYWFDIVKKSIDGANAEVDANLCLDEFLEVLVKENIVENDKRPDGRAQTELREIFTKVADISPVHHGSGLFYRGGTHVLSVLTLGGKSSELLLNTIDNPDGEKAFMHHYNFPPFSTGEVGRISGTNRRMIGHGALAEKALAPVIPKSSEFPYTIRLVSESMASNGSTSMGSVCASTIALMDGGVPIVAPVAGIAIGLMRHNKKHKVVTDIQGPEDHYGDMDFKVAGTRDGVTAIQMDVKGDGVSFEMIEEALQQGKKARGIILDHIQEVLVAPRLSVSERAPSILTFTIPVDAIGRVIGTGGSTIKEIRDETDGADINIDDNGEVVIAGNSGAIELAKTRIEKIVAERLEFNAGKSGGFRDRGYNDRNRGESRGHHRGGDRRNDRGGDRRNDRGGDRRNDRGGDRGRRSGGRPGSRPDRRNDRGGGRGGRKPRGSGSRFGSHRS